VSLRAGWVTAGQSFTLAQPVADLASVLRRYGYTVGTIGNGAHLDARTPEDHTPYSATGWPVLSPRWFVHALDIMPPPGGRNLPTLAQLGSQLVLDRNTGVPGAAPIKYLNWQPAGGNIRHEAWDPKHRVSTSNDGGHIHLSIRSDCTRSTAMTGYDPVARLRGSAVLAPPIGPVAVATAPPFPGRVLRLASPVLHGDDVRSWQARMLGRGWGIGVDGWYGQKSDRVCRQFQAEKRLTVDGRVGPDTWAAAWSTPVT